MPYVPLVDITVRLIRGLLAMAAVRRAAVVVDTGVLRYHGGENAFVDVPGGEVRIPKVARLIRIVKFEMQRLGVSVIYPVTCEKTSRTTRQMGAVPSLFPAGPRAA